MVGSVTGVVVGNCGLCEDAVETVTKSVADLPPLSPISGYTETTRCPCGLHGTLIGGTMGGIVGGSVAAITDHFIEGM